MFTGERKTVVWTRHFYFFTFVRFDWLLVLKDYNNYFRLTIAQVVLINCGTTEWHRCTELVRKVMMIGMEGCCLSVFTEVSKYPNLFLFYSISIVTTVLCILFLRFLFSGLAFHSRQLILFSANSIFLHFKSYTIYKMRTKTRNEKRKKN